MVLLRRPDRGQIAGELSRFGLDRHFVSPSPHHPLPPGLARRGAVVLDNEFHLGSLGLAAATYRFPNCDLSADYGTLARRAAPFDPGCGVRRTGGRPGMRGAPARGILRFGV